MYFGKLRMKKTKNSIMKMYSIREKNLSDENQFLFRTLFDIK